MSWIQTITDSIVTLGTISGSIFFTTLATVPTPVPGIDEQPRYYFYEDPCVHTPNGDTVVSSTGGSGMGCWNQLYPFQLQANWLASSGSSLILNKPTLGSASTLNAPASGNASTTQVVKGDDTRLTDSRAPLPHNQAWTTVTSTPTTLAGYGITDGVTSAALGSTLSGYVTPSSLSTTLGNYVTSSGLTGVLSGYATTGALTSGLAGKLNNPSGTSSQYLDGTGAAKSFPATLSGYGITDGVTTSALTGALGGYVPTTRTINGQALFRECCSGEVRYRVGQRSKR